MVRWNMRVFNCDSRDAIVRHNDDVATPRSFARVRKVPCLINRYKCSDIFQIHSCALRTNVLHSIWFIGLATAKKLAQYGATVVLTACSAIIVAEEAENINTSGGVAYGVRCDVSDYQSVEHCVNVCMGLTGRIDFLINVAGVIQPLAYLIDSDPIQWGLQQISITRAYITVCEPRCPIC